VRSDRREPSALAWAIASISLVLPFIGVGLALYGGWRLVRGLEGGWWWLGAGFVVIIADIVIDLIWAHPSVSRSDDPDLNRPGDRLAGRSATVIDSIVDGHGRIAIGDTVWSAKGPDCLAGTRVRIVSAEGALMRVVPEGVGSRV
jgi:hypothetical protein